MKFSKLIFNCFLVLACSQYDDSDIRNKSVGVYDGVVRQYNVQNNTLVYSGQTSAVTFAIDKTENPFHILLVLDGIEIYGTEIMGSKNAYNFNLDEVAYKGNTYTGYTGCVNERGQFDGTFLTETRQLIFYVQRTGTQEVLQFSGVWSTNI